MTHDSTHAPSAALSPWGARRHAHVEVSPIAHPFKASVTLPGSKSFTNRALIIASVARGESRLRAPLFSDDSYWCVEALRALGVEVGVDRARDEIKVLGRRDEALRAPVSEAPIYLGSAGTIARFLPAVFAARGVGVATFSTSDQLARRPLGELISALRALGAEITQESSRAFPLKVRGGSLRGGEVVISGRRSSQFISALLLAAPLTERGASIRISDHIVQSDYVRMTIEMMRDFGVEVDHDASLTQLKVLPQIYRARDAQLEADASTATYFLALAAATQSEVTIPNLPLATRQPDIAFLDCLERMGCEVSRDGALRLRGPQELRGGLDFDLKAYSDSAPALASIAPLADGPITLRGVEHIRGHECDRIHVLSTSLRRAGIEVDELRDGLSIYPQRSKLTRLVVDPHDDHRMAMSLSVLAASRVGGVIRDPACVSKTCPDFYQRLASLGVQFTFSDP